MRNPAIRTPQATDLSVPVGAIMRPTLTVEAVDSLARAAGLFRENGSAILPILNEAGRLEGVLTDAGLARALADMNEPTDAVGLFSEPAETLAPYASAAEALRRGEDGRTRVVVDDRGRVMGLVSAVDLWPRRRVPPKPAAVGGMATPFGVYLTTGNVSAGAPWWALMATGATMLLMLLAGGTIADLVLPQKVPVGVNQAFGILLFFLLMRFVPLSGTHGAEHQVVHAIEREEGLTPEVVRRMPLVHPRCGTNLMVGLSIFGAVQLVPMVPQELRLVIGLVLGIAFAMPMGALAQRYVTTRRPSDRQLAGAIRAGEALLQRYATARYVSPNRFQKIWSMGLLQVVAGAYLTIGLLVCAKHLTGFTWLPDLQF